MALRVIGASLGRTGTHSLKIALERLLGAPCYHMVEVFQHPEHVPIWHAAAKGEKVDWHALMEGYAAAVDWPEAAFWEELSEAFPDALILFSARDPESWWKSASSTIFGAIGRASEMNPEWFAMVSDLFKNKFTIDLKNKEECIRLYNEHNQRVLETAPKDRLLVWNVKEGWEPICKALNVPIPEEPFPLTNTTEEFLSRFAKRDEEASVAQ